MSSFEEEGSNWPEEDGSSGDFFSEASEGPIVEQSALEKLRDNAARLLRLLGGDGQNTLLLPTSKLLLGGDLTMAECRELLGDGLTSTLKRYRSVPKEDAQLGRLVEHSQLGREGSQIKRPRKEEALAKASEWVKATAGVTRSGRIHTTLKTSRTRLGFYEQYEREAEKPQIRKDMFLQRCRDMHVHFGVASVDFMSCEKCRSLRADVAQLAEDLQELEVGNQKKRARLEKRLAAKEKELEEHVKRDALQRAQFNAAIMRAQQDRSVAIVEGDYTTMELMQRGKAKVLGFVVTRLDEHNALVRRYVDLVNLPVRGRPSDGLSYGLRFLRASTPWLNGVRELHFWADAGIGDFRNSAAILSFRELCTMPDFSDIQLDLNYLAPLHGWNYCDRHFGSGKRHVEKWLRDEATRNDALFLDVRQLVLLLRELKNTDAVDCGHCVVPGFAVSKRLIGIQKYLHFEVGNGVLKGAVDSSPGSTLTDLHVEGEQMSATDAQRAADMRRAKRREDEKKAEEKRQKKKQKESEN